MPKSALSLYCVPVVMAKASAPFLTAESSANVTPSLKAESKETSTLASLSLVIVKVGTLVCRSPEPR